MFHAPYHLDGQSFSARRRSGEGCLVIVRDARQHDLSTGCDSGEGCVDSVLRPRRFERHIEMCPPCVRFLTTYRATGRTLKLLKPEEIPPDLAQSVLAFVRSRAGKKT